MFLLFSHQITQAQKEDAKSSLNIEEFVELPSNLQELWSSIPAELKTLDKYLIPLKKYLMSNASHNDIILIQGDYGGTHTMVNFCKDNTFTAVHSTTKRESKEVFQENKVLKTSMFEHVMFRKY